MSFYCQVIGLCDNLSSQPKRKKKYEARLLLETLFLEQGSNWKPSLFVKESLSKNICLDDVVECNIDMVE